MATWESLRSYVKTNYNVTKDDLNCMGLLFGLGEGRSQLVLVGKRLLGDMEWAEIVTPVCKESDIAPRDALLRNSKMVVGGLLLEEDGTVYFRHSFPLKDLDVDEFEVPFQLAVGFGDALEKELTGGKDQF